MHVPAITPPAVPINNMGRRPQRSMSIEETNDVSICGDVTNNNVNIAGFASPIERKIAAKHSVFEIALQMYMSSTKSPDLCRRVR